MHMVQQIPDPGRKLMNMLSVIVYSVMRLTGLLGTDGFT